MSFLSLPRPRVFGHRGASASAPENTLPAFAMAVEDGADYLELDVHGAADGVIVVLHDDTVDRTTDGSGPVREMAWSQLETLDAGYRFEAADSSYPYRGRGVRIPALESVLRAHPEHCFNIEIKQSQPAIIDEVIALLRRSGVAARCLLAAAEDSIMAEIRRAAGTDLVTGSSIGDVAEFFSHLDADTLSDYSPPGVALQIPMRAGQRELVTARSLAAAHERNLEVHVWTVNDVAEIEHLLDLGVDGIMSDTPGEVLAALARRRR